MDFTQINKRPSRAPRGALVGALLTLYICNIYPALCQSEGGDWLEISQVFDFQVPSEVIQQGVENATTNLYPEAEEMDLELQDYADPQYNEHLLDLADSVSLRDMRKRILVEYGFDTNIVDAVVGELVDGSYGAGGLTAGAISYALGDDVVDELFGDGEIPFFNVPAVDGLAETLGSDAFPQDNPFEGANPLLSGLTPPQDWFLSTLPAGSIWYAVFEPFDSEISSLEQVMFQGVRPFAYVRDTLMDICTNLEGILGDQRIVPRRLIVLPLSLLNIVLIFKWWLWRLTRIWMIITGTESASNPAGEDNQ